MSRIRAAPATGGKVSSRQRVALPPESQNAAPTAS